MSGASEVASSAPCVTLCYMATRDELLEKLKAFRDPYDGSDPETAHYEADCLLIEFINDDEIKAAYDAIEPKWYA